MSPTATTQAAKPPLAPTVAIAVLVAISIIASLSQTLVVPLVPQLPTLLHADPADTAWVVTITLLLSAVANPVMGKLGDMYGKRNMLLLALGALLVGSLVIAVSSELLPALIGRGLQGVGMAAIPLGMGILRDVLPPERLASGMGQVSASLGIGGALGLPLSALVVQYANWHILFYATAALALISLVLVAALFPRSAPHAHGRLDIPGTIGLTIGLVALLLAVSKGSTWGWGSPTTLLTFAVALVVLVGWGVLELRVSNPLVDLRATAKRQLLFTNLASVLVGFAMFASSLVPTQILQLPSATGYGLGLSLVLAGLAMAPTGLAMMAGSAVGARLTNARGPKISLLTGTVLLAISYLAGLFLLDDVVEIIAVGVLIGFSVGIAYAAMPSLIVAAVPPSHTGEATGLNSLMRSIGTSTAGAVIGMVLAALTIPFGGHAVPSLTGFHVTYIIAAGASLLGVLLTLFIRGRRAVSAETEPARTGQVLNQHGEPIDAAALTLISLDGKQLARANSDKDGHYALETTALGDVTLISSAPGHQPSAHFVFLTGETDWPDFVLSGIGTISGLVHNQDGPISGAEVTATVTGGGPLCSTRSVNGHYEFTGLVPGEYLVTVTANGHQRAVRTLNVGQGNTRCDIELAVSASIQGRLRYPDGRAAANATVTLLDPEGEPLRTVRTEAGGEFLFTGLEAGDYVLIGTSYAPATSQVSVRTATRHSVDLHFAEQPQPAGPPC